DVSARIFDRLYIAIRVVRIGRTDSERFVIEELSILIVRALYGAQRRTALADSLVQLVFRQPDDPFHRIVEVRVRDLSIRIAAEINRLDHAAGIAIRIVVVEVLPMLVACSIGIAPHELRGQNWGVSTVVAPPG